jgi:N-acetyl-D-muramate 6-phosphate phosphatase
VNDQTTLLVDLDGTLLDTAPDMAAALNAVRASFDLPALPLSLLRPHVSHGAAGLVRVGLPDRPPVEHPELRKRFVDSYRDALTAHGTALFAGFEVVLAALHAAQRPWGIVTNKPGWLTDPLLASLHFPHPPAVVVSGDTTSERKPHPLPITHACARLSVAPAHCLYVGDAERDIAAARAAGMASAIALWGYLDEGGVHTQWGADHLVETPTDLLTLLGLTA